MRDKKEFCIHFLICAVLLTSTLNAQFLQLNRSNSGFVDNFINKIVLFNGLPVVCTESGLSLVHSDSVETWRRGASGFPDAAVRTAAIFGGKLWIGTSGKGLARLDGETWKTFNRMNSGLIDDFVTSLTVWGTRMFIGTREGVCIFNGFLWEKVPVLPDRSVFVTSLAVDGETLWVGSKEGVYEVTLGKTSRYKDFNVFPPRVSAIQIRNQTVFVGFETALVVLPPNQGPMLFQGSSLPSGRLYDLLSTEGGVICATGDGLIRVDLQGNFEKLVLNGENQIPRLPITALAIGDGFLWLGLEGGGIIRLPENVQRVQLPRPQPQAANVSLPASERISPDSSSDGIQVSRVKNFLPPEAPKGLPTSVPTNRGDQSKTGVSPERLSSSTPGNKTRTPDSTFLSSVGQTNRSGPISSSWKAIGSPGSASKKTRIPPKVDATKPQKQVPTFLGTITSGTSTSPSQTSSPKQPTSTFLGSLSNDNLSPQNTPRPSTFLNAIENRDNKASTSAASTFLGTQELSQGPSQGISGSWAPIGTTSKASNPSPKTTVSVSNSLPQSSLGFRRDIQPLFSKKCQSCHTSGTGSSFARLSNSQEFVSYFKSNGTARLLASTTPGRGMEGILTNRELQLLSNWVSQSCRE